MAIGHALIIGVSEYDDKEISNLNFAESDAERFARLLQTDFRDAIGNGILKVLPGQHATKAAVEGTLNELYDETSAAKADLFIFYFSGHGTRTPMPDKAADSSVLLLANSNAERPATTGLVVDDVETSVACLDARHKIIILDSCFCGKSVPNGKTIGPPSHMSGRSGAKPSREVAFPEFGAGTHFLSASKANGFAYESDKAEIQGGILSHFLISALQSRRHLQEGPGAPTFVDYARCASRAVSDVTGFARAAKLDMRPYTQAAVEGQLLLPRRQSAEQERLIQHLIRRAEESHSDHYLAHALLDLLRETRHTPFKDLAETIEAIRRDR